MNNNEEKELPSENIQKVYEINPSYILKKIRNENINNDSLDSPIQHLKNEEKKEKYPIVPSNNEQIVPLEELDFNFDESFDSENTNNNNKINIIKIDKNTNKEKNSVKIKINKNLNSQINKFDIFKIDNNDKLINNIYLYNSENYNKIGLNDNHFDASFIPIQNYLSDKNKYITIKNFNIFDIEKLLSNLNNYWGSIYLQNRLYYMNDKEITYLLNIILNNINDIMCLQYGNYFFQKFIKKLKIEQKMKIYQRIEPYFLDIAKNKNGTHSIQSLFDEIKTPIEQKSFDSLLNKNMLFLFNDKNAYHIIMKIIIEKPESQRNNINLFLIENIKKIVINQYGAYCVNKFIVHNSDLNLRILLLKNIHNNIQFLFYHKCSCSILLLLLKYYNINSCNFIFQEIQNQIYFLIINPISNSFVNKILLFLKNNNYIEILNSIICYICNNDSLLKSISSNNNGNKLLNKFIEYSDITLKNYIQEKLNNLNK